LNILNQERLEPTVAVLRVKVQAALQQATGALPDPFKFPTKLL
jgi:hypothetical protein